MCGALWRAVFGACVCLRRSREACVGLVPSRARSDDGEHRKESGSMKFVTYDVGAGPRVGALEDGRVIDLGFEGDMVAFIEAGAPVGEKTAVAGARLLAPLRPRSLRDFLTFEAHLINVIGRLGREIAPEWYTVPAYYKGLPDTVIGPDEEIPWPAFTDRLDHELELAAVIGRRGKDIGRERALEYVFGYTIWNDVSARDVLARELPIGLGPAKAKDWDGSNALGPCIVTSDELDASALRMGVRVNGELWGEDSSANMYYTFADLIAYASQAQTLYPGDVFGSGTATDGSGIELDRWVREGDLVELEIEGIGVLRNRIGRKKG
jgi:2-keto-4-pentenoate hydratase/2-oxohepta-3-ene-1,7-dioic acid hydratase in catechol pathway